MSFGKSSNKTKQSSQSNVQPWDEAQPYLKDFLGNLGQTTSFGLSPDQQAAYSALKGNAVEGNPWTKSIADGATRIFDTAKTASEGVTSGLGSLKSRLGGYADGAFLDPMKNPNMKAMLDMVGTDAQDRVNAMFAGAGRDLSGMNQQSVAKGVTQAQLPVLFDQFNRQQGMQMDAAKTLFDGEGQAAQVQSGLADLTGKGAQMGEVAMNARDYAANQILNLDQQIKEQPLNDLGALASILFPAAGMGSSGTSSGTSKSSGSSFGISLSDERAKENIEQIGELETGEPIYRWNYIGGDEMRVGPIAQEVEETNPKAVITDKKTGLKFVDMKEATQKAVDIIKKRSAKEVGSKCPDCGSAQCTCD